MPATVDAEALLYELDLIRERASSGQLTGDEATALIGRLAELRMHLARGRWTPYPWQIPPATPIVTHGAWLMLGGRGTGKTEGAARYFDDHMMGPPCDPRIPGGHRSSIVAPSLGDAMDACVNGPSGLVMVNPAVRAKGGTGGTHVYWPNGAQARIFGAYTAQDIERLRAGGNRCCIWLEEAAAMRHLAGVIEHTSLGLRIGPRPHYVISTTPKARPELRTLIDDPRVQITKGRTREAIHLDPTVREALESRYGGTRLGRQELDAELLDDVEGALWRQIVLDRFRWTGFDPDQPWRCVELLLNDEDYFLDTEDGEREPLPPPKRPTAVDKARPWVRYVGVDPPGETAECGIVIGTAPRGGRAGEDHAVVLDDMTVTGPPEVWGARVVEAFKHWRCHRVYVEKNMGGDMVRSTIHAVDPNVPVHKIEAKDSKYDRAEPISALTARGWIHLAQHLPKLEEQLTTWVPGESRSPDRLDAMVHLCTKLLRPLAPVKASVGNPNAGRPTVARPTAVGYTRRR